jgi:hypothetical protein
VSGEAGGGHRYPDDAGEADPYEDGDLNGPNNGRGSGRMVGKTEGGGGEFAPEFFIDRGWIPSTLADKPERNGDGEE